MNKWNNLAIFSDVGTSLPKYMFGPYMKEKRFRTTFTPQQLIKLEEIFAQKPYVVGIERKQLASELNLGETQIKVCRFYTILYLFTKPKSNFFKNNVFKNWLLHIVLKTMFLKINLIKVNIVFKCIRIVGLVPKPPHEAKERPTRTITSTSASLTTS